VKFFASRGGGVLWTIPQRRLQPALPGRAAVSLAWRSPQCGKRLTTRGHVRAVFSTSFCACQLLKSCQQNRYSSAL